MVEEDGVEFRQQEANIERARRAVCVLCKRLARIPTAGGGVLSWDAFLS